MTDETRTRIEEKAQVMLENLRDSSMKRVPAEASDIADFAAPYVEMAEKLERMQRVCERAFQLQDAVDIEGRSGKLNCLQISKAWLELEKRAETAEKALADCKALTRVKVNKDE